MSAAVEELVAGKELDRMVAFLVFGAKGFEELRIYAPETMELIYEGYQDSTGMKVPRYSTDITAAWLVEGRVTELGLDEQYGDALAYRVMDGTMYGLGRVRGGDVFKMAHASPFDRCMAALATLEKP